MRKPIVAGNWKMNKTVDEARRLVDAIQAELSDCQQVDVVVCPPFTALLPVAEQLRNTSIGTGAQNMHHEKSGAFTGEISADMLCDVGCRYVVLGHSERRQFFGENDAGVNAKVRAALAAGLTPIVCVGETLQERESGQMEAVIDRQIKGGLAGLRDEQMMAVVIAYEPVWAIGTGKTATPDQAQEVHAFIRKTLSVMFTPVVADAVRLQYGGSVKASNAKELFSQPDIDGGLIGGAALEARSFVDIVKAALA